MTRPRTGDSPGRLRFSLQRRHFADVARTTCKPVIPGFKSRCRLHCAGFLSRGLLSGRSATSCWRLVVPDIDHAAPHPTRILAPHRHGLARARVEDTTGVADPELM